jgi:hypothetical protein
LIEALPTATTTPLLTAGLLDYARIDDGAWGGLYRRCAACGDALAMIVSQGRKANAMCLSLIQPYQVRRRWLIGMLLGLVGCTQSSRVPADDEDEGGVPRDAGPSADAMAEDEEPENPISFYTCWSQSRGRVLVYLRGPRHPEESDFPFVEDPVVGRIAQRIVFLFVDRERDNERRGFNPYSGRWYAWFHRHPDELPDGAEIGIARTREYDPDFPEEPELILGTFDADDILDECDFL